MTSETSPPSKQGEAWSNSSWFFVSVIGTQIEVGAEGKGIQRRHPGGEEAIVEHDWRKSGQHETPRACGDAAQ